MAHFEIGRFCKLDEYRRYEPKRVKDQTELWSGGLYIGMLLLKSTQYDAAIKPVRIQQSHRKSGMIMVNFTFLSAELNDEVTTTEAFEDDGYIHGVTGAVIYDVTKPRVTFPIIQAYFRDYLEGLDDFLQEQDQSLLVSV